MIYVTGDTHGNQYKWVEQIKPVLNSSDIILICGDFGTDLIGQKKCSLIF